MNMELGGVSTWHKTEGGPPAPGQTQDAEGISGSDAVPPLDAMGSSEDQELAGPRYTLRWVVCEPHRRHSRTQSTCLVVCLSDVGPAMLVVRQTEMLFLGVRIVKQHMEFPAMHIASAHCCAVSLLPAATRMWSHPPWVGVNFWHVKRRTLLMRMTQRMAAAARQTGRRAGQQRQTGPTFPLNHRIEKSVACLCIA